MTIVEPANVSVAGPSTHVEIKLDGTVFNKPDDVSTSPAIVQIDSSLHLPHMAVLSFNDNDDHDRATTFKAEQQVEISAVGVGDNAKVLLFKGTVAAIEAHRVGRQATTVIRCYSSLAKLFRGRSTRTFVAQKYSDIVRTLIQENGLKAGTIDTTSTVHSLVFQRDESDGDFLRRLAREIGFLLFADVDDTVVFTTIDELSTGEEIPSRAKSGPNQALLGDDLENYEISVGPVDAPKEVKVFGWDPKQASGVVSTAPVPAGSSMVTLRNLITKPGQKPFTVSSATAIQGAADEIAKSMARQVGSTLVNLQGRIVGNPHLQAGLTIAVGPPANAFAGHYLVTSVRHTVRDGNFSSEVVCGNLDGDDLPTGAAEVGGATDHTPWLVSGVVTSAKDEGGGSNDVGPEKTGRVKVKFPALGMEDFESDWLRVIGPGNGKERGLWWGPEVGDEVVVAFEQGDMRHGYVLGGVHNGKNTPPGDLAGKPVDSEGQQRQRALTTRTGHQLLFTDEKGKEAIELHDGKKKFVLKFDADKSVFSIDVESGQMLVKLDKEGGITIESQKKISIESKSGDVALKGQNVSIEATTDVKIKGINVKAEASAGFEAKGATTKVEASGMGEIAASGVLTVKGSMVKIN